MTCELRNHRGDIVSVGMYTALVLDAHSRADATGKVYSITMGDTTLQLVLPAMRDDYPAVQPQPEPVPYVLGFMLVVLVGIWVWQLIP